jgi:hypothetical protein
MDLGDTAAAHKFASQGLELARRVGHRREIVFAITTLAWIALDENRVDGARGLFEDGLALSYEIAKPSSAPGIVLGLAAVAAATGDGPRAARLAAAGEHAIATRFPYAELAPAQARLADLHLAAVRDRTSPAEWDARARTARRSRSRN